MGLTLPATVSERIVPPEAAGETALAGTPFGAGSRIVRNSAFNLTAQAVHATFHFAVVVVLARTLDKATFGRYFTFFALILLVQLVFEAGTSTVLARRISQAPRAWQATAAQASGLFLIIIAASMAAFLILGGIAAGASGDADLLRCASAAAVVCGLMQVEQFCCGVFQAFEWFVYENLGKVIHAAIFAASVMVLAGWERASTASVLALLAGSHAVAVVFLLVNMHLRLRCLSWRVNFRVARQWLAESVPLGLSDILRGLTWQIDTVLLGLLQPAAAVAIYSVAYRPLGPLNRVPYAILSAAFPAFSRMAGGDREQLQRAFATSIRLLWIASLPIAVSICVCAERVVTIIAGTAYLEAQVPLRILIWITSLSFLSLQFRFLFAAMGQQRLFVRLVVSVLLTEAAVEAALIPFWGYLGACAGSMLGEIIFTIAGLVLCHRLGIGGMDWKALMCAGVAAATMGAVLWPVRDASWLVLLPTALVSLVLYFLLCALFGALHRDEVRRLFHVFATRPAGSG